MIEEIGLDEFVANWGVLPRPIDYETYVGMLLLKNKAIIKKAYSFVLGLSEFHNEESMSEEWIRSISEDEFEAQKLGFQINAERASARVRKQQQSNRE